MGNILNHNRRTIEFNLMMDDYWDFNLCVDDSDNMADGLTERCLSAYIDMSDDGCIWFNNVYSKERFVWNDAINNNTLQFNSFGYTSIDNGKTLYKKNEITNQEFFNIFTTTKFKPQENDLRLTLSKVNGNHQIYDYSNDIALWNDKIQSSKLNGGWYQGFFCANDGNEYRVLPTDIGDGWSFEFILNKEDFHNPKQTLNDVYPDNKGIFFYIGTRAENKWWQKYLTNNDFDWCKKTAFADDYVENAYADADNLNDSYLQSFTETKENVGYFDNDSTFSVDYATGCNCDIGGNYVSNEYYEHNMFIDENMELQTEGGYNMYQPNIVEYKTDNKFLIFDRTCNGETADTWDVNTDFILHYINKPNIGNYFQLFHHGCDGYDTKKIQEVIDAKNKEYNVLQDIYRNALSFQIKDDGTLGYKYLVKDCDNDSKGYKIDSEFTSSAVVTEHLWYTIHIRIQPIRHRNILNNVCPMGNDPNDKMQIYFYVNGKLSMVSKELPILNLKKLADLNDKQQGVPFNISIGGGTQGLAEVVYLNYRKLPEYVLPLEKEFGGSFVGWIKSFRFYTCPLNYTEVVQNYNFDTQL